MKLELVEVQLLQVVLWPEEVAAAELQLMKLVLSFLASFASSAFLKLLLLFSLSQSPSSSSTEPFAEVVFSLDLSLIFLETGTCKI